VIHFEDGSAETLAMQVTAREPGAPPGLLTAASFFFNHSRGEVALCRVPDEGGVVTRMTHAGGLIHDWAMSPIGE